MDGKLSLFVRPLLILSSCSGSEESVSDSIQRKMQEAYPEGYKLEDGWYFLSSSVSYSLPGGENRYSYFELTGELSFEDGFPSRGQAKRFKALSYSSAEDGSSSERTELFFDGENYVSKRGSACSGTPRTLPLTFTCRLSPLYNDFASYSSYRIYYQDGSDREQGFAMHGGKEENSLKVWNEASFYKDLSFSYLGQMASSFIDGVSYQRSTLLRKVSAVNIEVPEYSSRCSDLLLEYTF